MCPDPLIKLHLKAFSKSKIERWFLTMRMQYLASLDMRDFHSLEEVRQNFADYVSRYNQSIHSSLEGRTPQERFFSEPEQIRRLTQEQIDTCFLLEVERRFRLTVSSSLTRQSTKSTTATQSSGSGCAIPLIWKLCTL